MKISIGSRIIDGPWGGGNLFVINLKKFLLKNNHEVIHDLCDKDIDIILLTDPRSRKESSSTFNHDDILMYKKYVNPDVVVIQRINECDERKGTDFINNFYLKASESADHVIFVSSWLRDIYINIGMNPNKTSVIMSGADTEIFNTKNTKKFNKADIKFVTHHWSSHENKGFDIYSEFDFLLGTKEYEHLSFTYIGNVPKDVNFKNITVKKPLSGHELANEIKKSDIYLTASKNEPSGNHHIEAAQCGLPILYRNSGGIPEYCKGFGVEFQNNFKESLDIIINEYEFYKKSLELYPYSSESMCEEFFKTFDTVKENKIFSNQSRKNIFLMQLFLFKNKIQKFLTSFTVKQNIKKVVKKILR